MAHVRLTYGDVEIGKPLAFAIHDRQGHTLLNHGFVIKDQRQLDKLVERGGYFDAIDEDSTEQAELPSHVSAYRLAVAVADEYEDLFADGVEVADIRRLPDIAGEIQKLCALDPDPLLAVILLYKSGRYSLRHSFACAILTAILMGVLEQNADKRRSAITGALAMNLAMLDLQDALYHQETPLTLEQKQALVLHPRNAARMLAERGMTDDALLDVVEDHHV